MLSGIREYRSTLNRLQVFTQMLASVHKHSFDSKLSRCQALVHTAIVNLSVVLYSQQFYSGTIVLVLGDRVPDRASSHLYVDTPFCQYQRYISDCFPKLSL